MCLRAHVLAPALCWVPSTQSTPPRPACLPCPPLLFGPRRKEEHIVFLVLGGWGVGIWGAMKVRPGAGRATLEAGLLFGSCLLFFAVHAR